MVAIIVVAYIATIACLVDALRRSDLDWAEADRQKGYWVTLLIFTVVIVLFAIVVVPAYVFGVMSRFSSANGITGSSNPFTK